MEKERKTRLIIEGNSLYEVDEECMKRGLNSQNRNLHEENHKNMERIRGNRK